MRVKKGRAIKAFLKKPWLMGAVIALVSAMTVYLLSGLSSNEAAEDALLSGQRVEVLLATGEVFGGLDDATTTSVTDTASDAHETIDTPKASDEHGEVAQSTSQAFDVEQSETLYSEDNDAFLAVDEEAVSESAETHDINIPVISEEEQYIAENDTEAPYREDAFDQNIQSSEQEPIIDNQYTGNQAPLASNEQKEKQEEEALAETEESAEMTPEEHEFSQKMLEERRKKISLGGGKKPIVVVITGVGLSVRTTEKTLEMPVNFTIGFSPYAPDVAVWNKKAIVLGFDTLLHLPMETPDYSVDDPGPYALVSTATGEENLSRLEMLLSLGVGYKGVYSSPSENFSTNINNMRPIVTGLSDMRMPFLYGRGAGNVSLLQFSEHSNITLVTNDVTIDNNITYEAINSQLEKLEKMAQDNEFAVGIARPYPLTLDMLSYWQKGLAEKNLEVVPFSLLVDQLTKE